MGNNPIEIKLDNKEIRNKLLDLSKKTESLRPLMKNIAGIFAYSTEENFKHEGRPKWQDLSQVTKNLRKEKKKWPGLILQVEGLLVDSISTYYDDNTAVIGSNQPYAAIHQLGGKAGKNKKVTIPARPYLKLSDDDIDEIIESIEDFLC